MNNIYNYISDNDDSIIKDPLITKEILAQLTPAQNRFLSKGKMLFNPINGDMIVPMMTQNGIAKIIVNIF
jgi:hypothetical protein